MQCLVDRYIQRRDSQPGAMVAASGKRYGLKKYLDQNIGSSKIVLTFDDLSQIGTYAKIPVRGAGSPRFICPLSIARVCFAMHGLRASAASQRGQHLPQSFEKIKQCLLLKVLILGANGQIARAATDLFRPAFSSGYLVWVYGQFGSWCSVGHSKNLSEGAAIPFPIAIDHSASIHTSQERFSRGPNRGK